MRYRFPDMDYLKSVGTNTRHATNLNLWARYRVCSATPLLVTYEGIHLSVRWSIELLTLFLGTILSLNVSNPNGTFRYRWDYK